MSRIRAIISMLIPGRGVPARPDGPVLCAKCQKPAIQDGFKVCSACHVEKPESAFYWTKSKGKYEGRCKACICAVNRREYAARRARGLAK